MSLPVLSVLIVTHNQGELLSRCLSSVVSQKLSTPFEVIISDDRSNDGTKDFVLRNIKQFVASNPSLIRIAYISCNSNECNPTTTSERCGWNKLNAYLHAEGKYFVNIDADDFLCSNDIYQRQIDALEAHPECSMSMQRALSVKDGDPVEKGNAWPQNILLKDGIVIDVDLFFREHLRGLNPTYMIRRHPEDDMKELYGKWFDDTVITYHHIQYGPVVYVDRADYVWMQYPDSISHKMTHDDAILLYGLLPLHHAVMIPSLKYHFLLYGLPELIHMFKWAPKYPELSKQYRDYWSSNNGFIYRFFTENRHSLLSLTRYTFIRYLLLIMKKTQLRNPRLFDFVERILLY